MHTNGTKIAVRLDVDWAMHMSNGGPAAASAKTFPPLLASGGLVARL